MRNTEKLLNLSLNNFEGLKIYFWFTEERNQSYRVIVAQVFCMTQMILNLHMESYSF